MDTDFDSWSDAELLSCITDPAGSFAVFYRRHVGALLRVLARQGADAMDAADLTAETFAAALIARERFDPSRGSAPAWVFGIAANKLADSHRRIRRETSARRRLALERGELTERDLSEYAALREEAMHALGMLAELPHDQRVAVQARVLSQESYSAIGQRVGYAFRGSELLSRYFGAGGVVMERGGSR